MGFDARSIELEDLVRAGKQGVKYDLENAVVTNTRPAPRGRHGGSAQPECKYR